MPEEANKPLVKQSADIPPFASACCQQTKPTNQPKNKTRADMKRLCRTAYSHEQVHYQN
ncbi:Uncharacterized protein APZ42_018527 [Daphnia magna]|uniref:Uncharacterized protein n=1 Tax=Daphnia magna TaxID=35525 RepID=A0A162CH89_9CRUS|nr:Uncharacterized protein APZ42_018527 [Daphnia magna]